MKLSEPIWRAVASFVSRPRVADWLIRRAERTPYFHLFEDGQLYMGRWWLFNPYDPETGTAKYHWCPWSIRIHHIAQPDLDKDLHDHPWNARTIVLTGYYLERRAESTYVRVSGSTASIDFGEFHRIAVVGKDTYTLFITGRRRGWWGFLTDKGKVYWKDYLARKPVAAEKEQSGGGG